MAEHSDLVAEIGMVEKMTTQERLKHAKKRRQQQLKKFMQYEKALDKEQNKKKKSQNKQNNAKRVKKERDAKVQFVSNVMLLEAAARNDVEEVRNLLMLGVNPDVTNEDGLTALHQCCIDDLDEMLRLLVQFNANVNARDSELWTPLHAAATCGHVHLCKFLIDHGAELLAVNADGNMAYDICEDEVTLDFIENEMAKRGVTQELIDETRLSTEKKMLDELHDMPSQGGSLTYHGRNGETPLHIAAANGYIQVAEYLLGQHVPVDSQDDDSWQPIHAAACWGHLPILEMLVQHGADLEARTKTGETPFDICEDIELKQRIMEMKDEIEANRTTHTKELKRRKSQNTRSASVRRTSMREKSQISWKEAREEAARLRNSAASDDNDSDEDENTPNGHPTNQPSEEHVKVPVTYMDDVKVVIPEQPRSPPREVKNGPTSRPTPAPNSHHSSTERLPKSSPQPHKKPDKTGSNNSLRHQEVVDSNHQESGPMPPATTSAHNDTPDHDLGAGGDNTSLGGGYMPMGTLADLKKQRQQKLQDSLRFKDPSTLNAEIQNYNANHVDTNSTPVQRVSNGKNSSKTKNDSVYYMSSTGDPPKKKFTATTEIVGGNDSNTSCCVIL